MQRLIVPTGTALKFEAEREARQDLRDLLSPDLDKTLVQWILAPHTN